MNGNKKLSRDKVKKQIDKAEEQAGKKRMEKSKFEIVDLEGKELVRRLVHDVKPIRVWLVIALLVSVAAVASATFAPVFIGRATDVIAEYAKSGVFDWQAFGVRVATAASLYVGYGLLSVLKTVLLNNTMSRHFNNKLRIRMSEKIMNMPVGYIDRTSKGELIQRMTDDVSVIGSTVHQFIDLLSSGVCQFVLIMVFAFLTDWHMAFVLLALAPASMVACALVTRRAQKDIEKYMEYNGNLYSVVEESYSGLKTLQTYGMDGFMKGRHADINGSIKLHSRRMYSILDTISPIMTFISMAAFALICVTGVFVVGNAGVTVGSVVAVAIYVGQIRGPLDSLASSMSMFERMKASTRRIYGMLALPEADKPTEKTPLVGDTVEFRGVSFGYVSGVPVIKNLDLSVGRGQKVAIVGPTGGGKTTIVNLLMRFYDPDSGSILVDGRDTKEIDRDVVRDCFEMVLQDTWLFGGTIADNVAYGVSGATREQVERACKAAYCDGFISTLAEGYDTVITHGATNISQGQKQLLTVARAFMAERPVLILDEATSNVDTRTEILLQRAMDKLMAEKTCFVIAHRLSTVINADVILVINDGEIIERGTHAELIAKGGFYADMFASQYGIV